MITRNMISCLRELSFASFDCRAWHSVLKYIAKLCNVFFIKFLENEKFAWPVFQRYLKHTCHTNFTFATWNRRMQSCCNMSVKIVCQRMQQCAYIIYGTFVTNSTKSSNWTAKPCSFIMPGMFALGIRTISRVCGLLRRQANELSFL